ncbi:MAG TPA: FAD:protein FMN transferase [Bacteroidota bacterium]|nr:FAD:protein FMN transferase [Bacteroidota bacterium]
MKASATSVIALVVVSLSCNRGEVQRIARETTAMDTYLSVTIYDNSIGLQLGNALIDSVFAEVNRIEQLMTDYSDTSEIGKINQRAGRDSVEVPTEVVELLQTARSFSERSGGAFDVTVGPLVRAWDFLGSDHDVPSRGRIRLLRRLVDFRNVVLDSTRVFLRLRGMRLDLGGIAKGYAVDRSVELLKRHGVRQAIVDLGGNLGVWWEGASGLDSGVAEILIRHPRKEGKFFGSFRVGSAGISTSGDYQRFFIKDGVRYHHILDPATGYPVRDVVSVTIIAPDATSADALSTLVFVLGRERGMDFIKNTEGIEGIIVWEEGDSLRYAVSPGLHGKFVRSAD